MNSRQRLLTALEHQEADRVPLDLSSTHLTGIHVVAYTNLCRYLGIKPEPLIFTDVIQQLVMPSEQVLNRFDVDTRGLFPLCSHNWNIENMDVGKYFEYKDEWGLVHHFPKEKGLYWSLADSPFKQMIIEKSFIDDYNWPQCDEFNRIQGLRETASLYRKQGKAIVVKSICAGLFEMAQRLRGMENFLCDLMGEKEIAHLILDKLLEAKKRYWKMTIGEIGDLVDVFVEADDYGTQHTQLISQETYFEFFEPRLKDLIGYMKSLIFDQKKSGEKGYIFFHSCGNVHPLLPSFIDIGIDILNPVHITAQGMDPEQLKKDFGDKITFWGGGVETQDILPNGTPNQVRENVKKNVNVLKAGGGFVFNTVHNIQADVPPQNIVAMWEAIQEAGVYE